MFDINWDAVGAIGSLLGALATFVATTVSLWHASFAVSPKIKVRVEFELDEEGLLNGSYRSTLADLTIANVGLIKAPARCVRVKDNFSGRSVDFHPDHLIGASRRTEGDWARYLDPGEMQQTKLPLFMTVKARPRFRENPLGFAIGKMRVAAFGPISFRVVLTSGKMARARVSRSSSRQIERAISVDSTRKDPMIAY